MRRSVTFELSEEVEYTRDGNPETSSTVTLKAPMAKNRQKDLFLKQQFLLALPKKKDQPPKTEQKAVEDEKIDDEDVMIMIGSCPDVDLASFFDCAKNVLCHGVAYVGEGDALEPMSSVIFDRLDFDDCQNMVGRYMTSFTIRSVLDSQKKS